MFTFQYARFLTRYLFLACVFIISGCSASLPLDTNTPPTLTEPPPPTTTNTPQPTLTPIPTETSTSLPKETATIPPTSTFTPTPLPSLTPTPTFDPNLQSSLDTGMESLAGMTISDNGRYLAVNNENGEISVWNLVAGEQMCDLQVPDLLTISFSPDQEFFSINNDKAQYWQVVSFSPDGQRFATIGNQTVQLWQVGDCSLVADYPSVDEYKIKIQFTPSGELAITGILDEVQANLTYLPSGEQQSFSSQNADYLIKSATLSPDGKILAVGRSDGQIELYRTVSGKQLQTLKAHDDWVIDLAFSPDSQLLASGSFSFDPLIKIWQVKNGKLVSTLEAGNWDGSRLAFSPDGSLLASYSFGGSKLWQTDNWSLYTQKESFLHFSPDGIFFTEPDGEKVSIWHVQEAAPIQSFDSNHIQDVAFPPFESEPLVALGMDNGRVEIRYFIPSDNTQEELSMLITDDYGIPMALIPAGPFEMGMDADDALAECQTYLSECKRNGFEDEEPIHTITLNDYYMDQYAVTNQQLTTFLNEQGNEKEGDGRWYGDITFSSEPDERIYKSEGTWQVYSGYEDHPAVDVSWYGARAYCEWRGARLPTEAEWEKAARGGLDGALYPWGNKKPVCNFGAKRGAQYFGCGDDTVAVGSFSPNGYNLYDMAGNTWEWLADWYAPYYYANSPSSNPQGSDTGTERVRRGGAWELNPIYMMVAYRDALDPSVTVSDTGFRCVRTASP